MMSPNGIAARIISTVIAMTITGIVLTCPAMAEPVLDRALSGLRVLNKKSCETVQINFNFRIRYVSHFPIDRGDELRIVVQPIDKSLAASLSLLKREALRPPEGKGSLIKNIEFEASAAGGPVLRIQFTSPTAYQIAPGADFESIIIATSGKTASMACKAEFPTNTTDNAWNTTVVRKNDQASTPQSGQTVAIPTPAPGSPSESQTRQAAAWMDEARAAIKKSDYSDAVSILSKVRRLPENPYSLDALELTGVAYQKHGKLNEARAAYEGYINTNANGEGADRVRQRLAGITTTQSDPATKLRSSRDKSDGTTGNGAPADGATWSLSGSASEFYYRDDSYRSLRDPSLPPDINAAKDDHQVHRNVLLSSFDVIAAWNNASLKSKFRFSGTQEHSLSDIDPSKQDILAVASLNLETMIREWDLTTRIGRQSRNTGGVLGRFDGGLVSWQANPALRLNAVAGSPVERRKDEPFKDEKLFYGMSVDFGSIWGGLETSLFAIEQRDGSTLDRQAVGAEFRYLQPGRSFFANFDYDVHFNELNAAIISGSWTLADKSTLSGGVDYRKAPYLSAWTALQGQPVVTLHDLLKLKTKDEIDQLAIDRTATYQSATLGYSKPINDHLQFNIDGTVANISGTISSGGVEAALSPGTDYYASTQLIATDLVTPGDMYIGGLRYANRPDSNLYVLDMSTRYPLTNDLRVSPRIAFSYLDGKTNDLQEVSILPSVLFNYAWSRDLSMELEAGTKWTQREQGGTSETLTDLFFTVGIRYDFNADGRTKCAYPSPVCR
jgi:tetratricopeptide (TPR) repeat protein